MKITPSKTKCSGNFNRCKCEVCIEYRAKLKQLGDDVLKNSANKFKMMDLIIARKNKKLKQ